MHLETDRVSGGKAGSDGPQSDEDEEGESTDEGMCSTETPISNKTRGGRARGKQDGRKSQNGGATSNPSDMPLEGATAMVAATGTAPLYPALPTAQAYPIVLHCNS